MRHFRKGDRVLERCPWFLVRVHGFWSTRLALLVELKAERVELVDYVRRLVVLCDLASGVEEVHVGRRPECRQSSD